MNIHKKFEVFLYSLLSSVISMNVLWEADVYSEKNIYLGMLITIQSFIGTRVILEFIYRNIFSHKLWFHKEESMFNITTALKKSL